MYIKRLYIRNFRNFQETTADFSVPVTAVIGENGAGKSNLIYALRLLFDAALSRQGRTLEEDDFHDRTSIGVGKEIIIGAVLTDFEKDENDRVYCAKWKIEEDLAVVTYRFRPEINARMAAAERTSQIATAKASLTGDATKDALITIPDPWKFKLDDYEYERVGGLTFTTVGGFAKLSTVRFTDDFGVPADKSLNSYIFVDLPAIRDVVRDMSTQRASPLHRLINLIEVPEDVRTHIEDTVKTANDSIRSDPFFKQIQEAIDDNYEALAAFPDKLSVNVGLADPVFTTAIRSLGLLMTDSALTEADMSRNGLGFNNLLYVAILLEYFRRRAAEKGTNQLLTIEEPEAHLHPNAQTALMGRMTEKTHQTIVTSHSPAAIAALGIASVTALVKRGKETVAIRPVDAIKATDDEIATLNRYLDGSRSAMLFARKVVLVEGLSEELILRAFARIRKINLTGNNIAIITVNGTYFGLFARLFASGALPTKCLLVRDGDSQNSPMWIKAGVPDDGSRIPPTDEDGVSVFQCRSTLEMALSQVPNRAWVVGALQVVGATTTASSVNLQLQSNDDAKILLAQLAVLRTAKRVRKGRFSQALADTMPDDVYVPGYLSDVLDALT